MNCPSCNTPNPDQAKFCLECGYRFSLKCPQCGSELPAAAKFCFSCGAPVGQAAQPALQAGKEPAPGPAQALVEKLQRLVPRQYAERLLAEGRRPENERRIVTILFSDVKGSTQMAEQLDPEEVMEIMDEAFEVLIEPVYRHEGTLARLMGDAVLAFFGAPISHENDPERACRAALEIIAGAQAFAQKLEHERGISGFNVRVGINTGLVVVGEIGTDLRVEYTAIGDAINLAARMEQNAPPGGILVSHETYKLIRGAFDTEPLGPIEVKGRSEPVPVYLVQQAKPAQFYSQQRGIEGIQTPMVGRNAELEHLEQMWLDACHDGQPRSALLVGEAGVGKSRLLLEFSNWLEARPAGASIFRGRCTSEARHQPYSLFRSLFANRLSLQDADTPAQVSSRFQREMSCLSPGEAALVGHLVGFDLSSIPAVRSMQDSPSFQGVASNHLLKYFREAAQTPTAVYLEDLHWADSSSLELVERLPEAISAGKLLLVGLARPSLYETSPNWGQAFTRLDLEPLPASDSQALVETILGKVADLPASLRDLIVKSAEGNPFYVEELIKMLIDDGVILTGESSWHVEMERVKTVRVPTTLSGVLQARLDTLSPAEKAALQQAAVIGRTFWDEPLENLAGRDDLAGAPSPDLDSVLRQLGSRQLVFPQEHSAFAGSAEYMFKHAILRDVTYESVLLKLRRVYHGKVAEWLEANSGERIQEYAALIAEHLQRSGQPAKAAFWLKKAAHNAMRAGAYPEVIRAVEQALALTPEQEEAARAELFVLAGAAQNRLGEYTAAVDSLQTGLNLARKCGNDPAAVEALLLLRWVAAVQGREEDAIAWINEAMETARRTKDPGLIGQALSISAGYRNDLAESLKHMQEALQLLRQAGQTAKVAGCLLNMGNANVEMKALDQARAYYLESLEIYRELGHTWGIANCLGNLGDVAAQEHDYSQAAAYMTEALQLSRQIGDKEMIALTLSNLGEVGLLDDKIEITQRTLPEALAVAKEMGAMPFIYALLDQFARLKIIQNDLDKAARVIGLVQVQPYQNQEYPLSLEPALSSLRERMLEEQLETCLSAGKSLDLDRVVADLIAGRDW